jgi:hypothetical protein
MHYLMKEEQKSYHSSYFRDYFLCEHGGLFLWSEFYRMENRVEKSRFRLNIFEEDPSICEGSLAINA